MIVNRRTTSRQFSPAAKHGAPDRGRQPRGFTLIEVVLAIGIFAIVLVSINTAFFAGMRLRQRTSEALEETLPLTRALALMRRDLQNAVPPGGTLVGDFRGGVATLNESIRPSQNSSGTTPKAAASVLDVPLAPGLDFYTTTGRLSDDVPWADVQEVNYQLVQPDDPSKPGMVLVRSVARNLLAITSETARPQRLAENIETLDFFFWDGLQWRDQWDTSAGDTTLPAAVSLRVHLVPPANSTVRREPVEMLVLLPAVQSSTNNTTSTEVTP